MHRLVRHGFLRLPERHAEVHVSLLLMIGGALRIGLLLDFLDLILFIINEGASEFGDWVMLAEHHCSVNSVDRPLGDTI
jgi:hypothetical protein